MLQVLLHTSIQTLREPDDKVSANTLLSEVQSSAFDLCQILFKFFGKNIVQPRCDLFEKAIGLWSLTILALASLLGLNPNRLWLLPGNAT